MQASIKILQEQTLGLELLERDSGRFILLPKGMTVKTDWTFKKRKALKLEE